MTLSLAIDVLLGETVRPYEALNLVDGRRTSVEIADALTAIDGATSVEDVEQYLTALASIGVILPSGTAP
jgi:hypothetical protein